MNTVPTTAPTRYEILAKHDDGREFLISYAAGSPSRFRLLSAMQANGDAIIAKLAIGATDEMTFGTQPRPFAKCAGWTIAYTGRTQREVLTLADARQFVAA